MNVSGAGTGGGGGYSSRGGKKKKSEPGDMVDLVVSLLKKTLP